MSNPPAQPTIAYLAQGKIRLKSGDSGPRTLDSVYGNGLREKAVRTQQRHSWKAKGEDASPFAAFIWGKGGQNSEVPLAITSLCGGRWKSGTQSQCGELKEESTAGSGATTTTCSSLPTTAA